MKHASSLYIDTNILIYLFEQHDSYSQQVAATLEDSTRAHKQLVTSVVSVTEFLAGTDSSNLETLRQIPGLLFIPLDEALAEQAALLQRKHGMKIGDSIHLATAIQQKAETFFTNNNHLLKVTQQYMATIGLQTAP